MTKAEDVEEAATDPDTAPAYMMPAVLGFNEQLERIGEVAVVLLVVGLVVLAGLSGLAADPMAGT